MTINQIAVDHLNKVLDTMRAAGAEIAKVGGVEAQRADAALVLARDAVTDAIAHVSDEEAPQ